MKQQSNPSARLLGLDVLRAMASISVVLWHLTTVISSENNPSAPYWHFILFIRSITRWTNGCFIMISGYILLDNRRTVTISNLFKKRILHHWRVYIFWNTISWIVEKYRNKQSWQSFYNSLTQPFWQLWFMPMTISLTIITPLLRFASENEILLKYYIVLCFLNNVLLPTLNDFQSLKMFYRGLSKYLPRLPLYSGYFTCGYYLGHYELKRSDRI